MSDELSIEEILEMPEMADVREELSDARYAGRTHSKRATYALGCHGPLCQKAERDRGRVRNANKAIQAGRSYQASIHRKRDRDELLQAIIEWHQIDTAKERIRRALEYEQNRITPPGDIVHREERVERAS